MGRCFHGECGEGGGGAINLIFRRGGGGGGVFFLLVGGGGGGGGLYQLTLQPVLLCFSSHFFDRQCTYVNFYQIFSSGNGEKIREGQFLDGKG